MKIFNFSTPIDLNKWKLVNNKQIKVWKHSE